MNWRCKDLEVSPLASVSERVRFDLEMHLRMQSEGNLRGTVVYSTDLFDAATIERMVGHFQTLLEGIVADPDRRLWRLPLLTEAERHRLLVEWNDTRREYPRDKCVHQLFEEQVARTPEAVAVVFEDQQLTYRELNARSNQLAHYLRDLGVGPEMLVGICLERSLEMVVGLLGILKAGGAYVPLDPDYPAERLAFLLRDSAAPVLLTQKRLLPSLPDCPARVLCLDADASTFADMSDLNPLPLATPDNLAYVIYTSGSTGDAQGSCSSATTTSSVCSRDPAVVRLRSTRRLDAVPLLRFRLLGVGDLGGPRSRRSARGGPLRGDPFAPRVLPAPAR